MPLKVYYIDDEVVGRQLFDFFSHRPAVDVADSSHVSVVAAVQIERLFVDIEASIFSKSNAMTNSQCCRDRVLHAARRSISANRRIAVKRPSLGISRQIQLSSLAETIERARPSSDHKYS